MAVSPPDSQGNRRPTMSQSVHTHAVTVTFADAFEPRTKVRKCTLAEGQSAKQWANSHFVRPVKSAKAVVLAPAPVQEAKPVAASKPAPAPVTTSKPLDKLTKAELLALIADLAPKAPEVPSAPVRKPRVTQTRAERKASRQRKTIQDAKTPAQLRHEARMEASPVYADEYAAGIARKLTHPQAVLPAWKAMMADFEAQAIRKARKAASRKAA